MWLERWRIVADMAGYFRRLARGGSIVEVVVVRTTKDLAEVWFG